MKPFSMVGVTVSVRTFVPRRLAFLMLCVPSWISSWQSCVAEALSSTSTVLAIHSAAWARTTRFSSGYSSRSTSRQPARTINSTQLQYPDHLEDHLSVGLYLLARFSYPQHDPDAVLKRIKAFIEQTCADLAPEISTGMRDISPTLFCGLHPAAEDVEISFLDSSHLTASGNTAIGAGYHTFLCKLLK